MVENPDEVADLIGTTWKVVEKENGNECDSYPNDMKHKGLY